MGMWDWHDERMLKSIKNLFRYNLCVSREDNLLVLSDAVKERFGELFFSTGSLYCAKAIHTTYQPTKRHGAEPPELVWKATFGTDFLEEVRESNLMEKLLSKQLREEDEEKLKCILLETTSPQELPTVVVAVNEFSLSHTTYRKLCTEFLSMRFASMPLFQPFMFYTAMQADWKKVERRAKLVAELLTEAEEVRVLCPRGTDITFSTAGRSGIADTGRLCNPGDFGNLPAGEGFIAPVEGSAQGVLVTAYAPTRALSKNTVFTVEGGKVVKVEGDEEFCSYITGILSREENAGNIAEFGVGVNERAKHRDNILEAEKILGTCHIAIGDNSAFGGKVKANIHIDLLVELPTVRLKTKGGEVLLMEEGKLLVG